jgi:cell division protein FtsQ
VQSLSVAFGTGSGPRPALAGAAAVEPRRAVLLRRERSLRGRFHLRTLFERRAPRGVGAALSILLLAAVTAVGLTRGGEYQVFVENYGGVGDVFARALGFGVEAVTVSGAAEISEKQILALAGISPKLSLPFFDVAAARAALEAAPLISHASVRKLYPNQIVIEIVERTPYALWQKDGEVHTIAADGAVIDELRDPRFASLPFVVGDGANARVAEFSAMLGAMAELEPRVEAGVLIDSRRWNLRMKSGTDIKLPEADPLSAIATLLRLQRQSRILDRDILSLDFRVPGRVFVRLTEEAAAARVAAAHAKKGVAR